MTVQTSLHASGAKYSNCRESKSEGKFWLESTDIHVCRRDLLNICSLYVIQSLVHSRCVARECSLKKPTEIYNNTLTLHKTATSRDTRRNISEDDILQQPTPFQCEQFLSGWNNPDMLRLNIHLCGLVVRVPGCFRHNFTNYVFISYI
jgi:hypothetical protein